MQLRINILPAIISAKATATWAAIKVPRSRRLRMGEVPALALSAAESAERELSSAGASPNRMPAAREIAKT